MTNIYPDPQNTQMSQSNPRKNYLDDSKIKDLPNYAFPTGYEIKFQAERPANELIPMMYTSEDKIHLQFLIFYESLDENIKTA